MFNSRFWYNTNLMVLVRYKFDDIAVCRNSTIQKWYDKTRVASGKLSKGFSAFEQSAVKQIEQVGPSSNSTLHFHSKP